MAAVGITYGSVSYEDSDLDFLFGKGSPIGITSYGFYYPSYVGVYATLEGDSQDERQFQLATFERYTVRLGICGAMPLTECVVLFAGGGLTSAGAKISLTDGSYAQDNGVGGNVVGGIVASAGPVGIEVRLTIDRVEAGDLQVGGTQISAGLDFVHLTWGR